MKKKFLSIILTAVLATTAIGSAAALTASAAEVNTSSVSAGQYAVSTPQLSNIENADGQVNLSWKSVSGAYKYRVYYKGRNGWTKFAETTGTTAVDDVVKSGSTYTYTIRALDKNNNFVSDFNRTGWRHTYVSVPKFTSIENTNGQVNLSWRSVAGAYKYRVYYKGRNGWTRFAETTGTTAVDDVVRSGVTYTYTVRALDKNNNFVSDFNHTGWKHMYVSNPKFSKIENLEGGVKLTWKSVDGAYKYRVYYKSKNGWTRFAETTGTTAVDDVVRSGATYTYTVRALDKNNNFLSDFNHSGWQHTYIATPKITNLENTVEGIKITWNKVEGAEFYRVFYRGSDGWKRLTTTADTSVVDTNVKAGNTYTYTVRCIDRMDNYISDYVSPGWQLKRLEWHDAVYEYIEHPAETEQVWVVDKESYTVEDGVYERHSICKGCIDKASEIVGYRIWDIEETDPRWYEALLEANINPFLNGMTEDEIAAHGHNHMINNENDGWYTATVRIGTQTITVPEEGHWETKVIKEAWTEKVLVKEAGFYDDDGKTWHDAVYEYIDHPAETEQVWVVDKESYTVEDGVYERHVICKGCVDKASEIVGYRLWDIEETEPEWYAAFQKAGINPFLDEMEPNDVAPHSREHLLADENAGSYTATVRIGTQTITVPEEGHWETKVIKEAWTEKVLVREAGFYDDDGKTWHDAVYEYIDHPAETEQVWVVDKESYTVEDGIYERHNICKGCIDKASEIVGYRLWDIEETEPEWYAALLEAGIDPFLENMSADERSEHFYNHMINDENAGYYTATVRVGTQTITVPEEGHWETKVIKEAWTEKVLVKEAGWY